MSYTRSPSVVRAESSASVYEVRGRKEEERRGGEGDIRQEHQERCRIKKENEGQCRWGGGRPRGDELRRILCTHHPRCFLFLIHLQYHKRRLGKRLERERGGGDGRGR